MISMSVEQPSIEQPNLNDQKFWINFQNDCERIEREHGFDKNPEVKHIEQLLNGIDYIQKVTLKDHVLMTRKVRISFKRGPVETAEVQGNNLVLTYNGNFDLHEYADAFEGVLNIRKIKKEHLGPDEYQAILLCF